MTTPAHPGSRIDRTASAAAQAAPDLSAAEAHQADIASVEPNMLPVPVDIIGGEGAIWSTRVIPAGGAVRILPTDPMRRNAIVMAIDNPIVLCQTQELAQAAANTATGTPYPTGFYLPSSGNNAVPLRARGEVWAANTSASATTRVSILVERSEAPNPLG